MSAAPNLDTAGRAGAPPALLRRAPVVPAVEPGTASGHVERPLPAAGDRTVTIELKAAGRDTTSDVARAVPAAERLPALPPLATRLLDLGAPYLVPAATAPLPHPQRLAGNDELAAELGLPAAWWFSDAATEVLAGNRPWPGYAPQATVYAGHQFGRYTAQLGDGRATLIAELNATPFAERLTRAGQPIELQLKGAGPTPYARGADGRAVLRASIREFLACEALHALGVPTTRALALIGSPLGVARDRVETAAVLARTAPSFLRFGHFEYHARRGAAAAVRVLAEHAIEHHFPQWRAGAAPLRDVERYVGWLTEVVERQAALTAHWQSIGFCHGVLNTDNCSILGLTLDYGPYGFIERYRPFHVCNASDTEGRYAYSEQPAVGEWNCARLLDACAPLLGDTPEAAAERVEDVLAAYGRRYRSELLRRWRAKLGLAAERDDDLDLVQSLLAQMHRARADFTQTFRALGQARPEALRERFAAHGDPAAFDAWQRRWRERRSWEGQHDDGPEAPWRVRMRQVNPAFVLRNHLAQTAIAAAEHGDLSELLGLWRVLQRPFDAERAGARYAEPAPAGQAELEVSCSS